MDDKQRLQLSDMIKTNNVEDQTGLIRNLKHSQILRNEINTMVLLKEKYKGDAEKINSECVNDCAFLFTYYTDIFNKVRKDEIDINILDKFLDVLRQIENNELDQHEGSFAIGTLLKKLYIDSALKRSEKLDANSEKTPEPRRADIKVSWNQFKNMNNK